MNEDNQQSEYYLVYEDDEYADEYLPYLKGPNGFMCVLTEPEDRTFNRDANDVVTELNRLAEIIKGVLK